MTPSRLLEICAARVFLFAPFMTVAAVIPVIMEECGGLAPRLIASERTLSLTC